MDEIYGVQSCLDMLETLAGSKLTFPATDGNPAKTKKIAPYLKALVRKFRYYISRFKDSNDKTLADKAKRLPIMTWYNVDGEYEHVNTETTGYELFQKDLDLWGAP